MFKLIVAKWAGGLLLPPVSLLLLIAAGLWISRSRRWGRWLAATGVVLLWLCSTPLIANALLRSVEDVAPLRPPFAEGAGAIVVLGGGSHDAAPEWGGPSISPMALQRVRYAAWLHRQTGLPLLVTGGAPDSRTPEAVVMARILRTEFAVPVRWVEDQALDTAGNAEYSARMLSAAGVRRVYVVSQAWHLPRALPQFSRRGVEAIGAPTAFTPNGRRNMLSVLPNGHALLNSYLACHEWVGRVAYAMRDALSGEGV